MKPIIYLSLRMLFTLMIVTFFNVMFDDQFHFGVSQYLLLIFFILLTAIYKTFFTYLLICHVRRK